MKLKSLTIENFGVYKGKHKFDLQTYPQNGVDQQNVIIIKGANGSGKTTLFRAIAITLFGRLTLGSKVSNNEYSKYLIDKLHKHRSKNQTKKTNQASIELAFDYVQSGKKKDIVIKREWDNNSSTVEKLDILVNGTPPKVQDMDYQSWLNDFFPPGLLQVLCFDAEDMNALIRAKDDEELKKVVKRLLGLNLVEQLDTDISYYLRNTGGGNKYESLKEEVVSKQHEIDSLQKELDQKKEKQLFLDGQEKELNSKLSQYERELSSEGGDYAARRPLIKERISQLDKEIDQLESRLRELSAGLLPFTFAPKLSRTLSQRLDDELDSHRKNIAANYLEEKVNDIASRLSKSELWKKKKIKASLSKEIISEIKSLLHDEVEKTTDDAILLHELSENDVLKVKKWIQEATNSIPSLALHISKDLKNKKEERSEHQEYLNRAPEDSKLEPIFENIRKVEDSLFETRKASKVLSEEIGSTQFKLEQVKNEQEKFASKLHEIEKQTRKISMAQKSKMVLESYSQKLSQTRIGELSDALVECFNRICDKEQLLSEAQIDSNSFNVTLIDQNGNPISIDDFSMGESQIYGLALLWALRKISGLELPLLIDTPIARLDKTHQTNFIQEFLPDVSDQILLFTTNVEMSDHIQKKLIPRTSQIYELRFDEKKGETIVTGDGHRTLSENQEQLKAS